MTFDIGQTVGPYRITDVVGSGGMGAVYRVEHVLTRRVEAIKILARGRPASSEDEQRFLREIQVQASLNHPHIAAVHNAFWADGDLVLVMELVEGESLGSVLQRRGVHPAESVEYVCQVLDALQYAHGLGIVHRDVSPGNILVMPNGQVKLTDFGLARPVRDPGLTESGMFVGSPYYASPEQVKGHEAVDARSDVYSLGVVLYELLTGTRPFQGAGPFEIMLAHTSPQPPRAPAELNPGIGPSLNSVVLRALAKHPGDRYQTAQDFREALVAAREGIPLPPVRPRLPMGLAAALCASVLAIAALGAWLNSPTGTASAPPPSTHPVRVQEAAMLPTPVPSMPVFEMVQPPAQPEVLAARVESPSPAPVRKPAPRYQTLPRPPAGQIRIIGAEPPEDGYERTARLNRPTPTEVAYAFEPTPPPHVAVLPHPTEVATPDSAVPPQKKRHAVVRAFGKVFGGLRGKKEEQEAALPAPPPDPAPLY